MVDNNSAGSNLNHTGRQGLVDGQLGTNTLLMAALVVGSPWWRTKYVRAMYVLVFIPPGPYARSVLTLDLG